MLYILKQYLSKSLLNKKQAVKVLLKTIFIYCQKLYFKPINKADTKPVTINITAISAINTHFYIQHKENKAFLASIYKIDCIL
jgi:hypothetical protein